MIKICANRFGSTYIGKNTVVKTLNISRAQGTQILRFYDYIANNDKYPLFVPLLRGEWCNGSAIPQIHPLIASAPREVQKNWHSANIKTAVHLRLEMPKITKIGKITPMNNVYWTLSKHDRYNIVIELLETVYKMHLDKWYNPCTGTSSFIISDTGFKWINYTYVTRNPYVLPIIVQNIITSFASYCSFPHDSGTICNHSRRLKNHMKYKSKIDSYTEMYGEYNAVKILGNYIDYCDPTFSGNIHSNNIKRRYAMPHNMGISTEDVLYAFDHLNEPQTILTRFKKSRDNM